MLAVADSPTDRRLLDEAMTGLGHDCIAVEEGLRAWELFQNSGADVVISSWMMPDLTGDELCRKIRSSNQPYAYFILFCAKEEKKSVLEGMEAGADDYLAKPLDRERLEACLVAAARVTTLHRQLVGQQGELERLNRELYEQSRQDALTGVGNRLRMQEDLETIEGNVQRYGLGYAVALCDVDRFKDYNDNRGHPAGDLVLQVVAAAVRGTCRSGDAVYRYGGEELLVLLPGQSIELAIAAAERMRLAVETLEISHPHGNPLSVVTISVGVAVRDADIDGHGGIENVLSRADQALYRAKTAGRNRVVHASDTQ